MGYVHANSSKYSSVEAGEGLKLTIRSKKTHDIIDEFKQKLCKNLWDRFEYVNTKPNLLIATFLDPRYKDVVIEHYLGSYGLHQAIEYTKAEALKTMMHKEVLVDEPEISENTSSGTKVRFSNKYSKLKIQIAYDMTIFYYF